MRVNNLILIILVMLGLANTLMAVSDRDKFIWDQANAQAMGAVQSEEFIQAATTYNSLVLDGVYNGALFINLGNLLVMGGDGRNGAAAFARAERYIGATPESRQGLKAALALQHGGTEIDLPWSRTAFFWHYALSCWVRTMAALSGWSLLWLGVCIRILRGMQQQQRNFSRSLSEASLFSGGLIALIFGVSVMITVINELHDRDTWPERNFMHTPSVGEEK